MEYAIKIKGLYLVKNATAENQRLVNKIGPATHFNDMYSAYDEVIDLARLGIPKDEIEIVKFERYTDEKEVDEPIIYTKLFEKKELNEKEIIDFLKTVNSFDGKDKQMLDNFINKFIKDVYPHVVSLKGYEYLFKALEKYYLELLSIDESQKDSLTVEIIQERCKSLESKKLAKIRIMDAVFDLLVEYKDKKTNNLKNTLHNIYNK
ncbi:hypothetical protein [Streptococcus canis]|uniref:Uncharacterized protein n=1 Tax=Streptococcus canis TaxID=1329 RepID=A0AAE4Q6H4_STRCB|nr:hypothetical protein [Streptococcus canis]MDV5977930.1 hypothetical protein [Streptococcus canis]